MTTLKRIVVTLLAMLLAQSASAALLSIAQYPLFLTNRTLPNVLVVFDNSESMDATMAGKVIAGDDPTTRGNIARAVIRNTISSFSGQFNWGLETFEIGGAGLYSTYPYWLGNDQTMVFTDDCVGGISASNGGLRCIDNPQWGGGATGDRYVTYDRASDDPDINDVLYIGYFGSGAWATTAGGGAYNFFFNHAPGPAFEPNMYNYWATFGFTPTDAGYIPYNPPISRQLYAYRAWGFYAGVSGRGVINEPVQAPSVPGHLANIQALLASETPYGPELKNAAVFTPLAGSMLTANQYFAGGSSPITLSCQKSFVMLATDGNPTSDWWGNMYPLDQQVNTYNTGTGTWSFSPAARDVFGQISALRTVTVGGVAHDVQTYVVGMGDTVANPSSVAAMNQYANLGGTGTAYLAQDATSLTAAFQAIAVDIESKTAAASAVSLNTGSWGTGTNLYQARFNSGDWSGQLIAYAINMDGSIGAQQWDSGQVINGQNWNTGRAILTYKPSAALGAHGIPFRWPASPSSPTATEMDVAQSTLLNTPPATSGGGLMNVAASGNGGIATASSYYNSGYGPGHAINGDRSGASWGSTGGWNSAYWYNFPEWLQINFNGQKNLTQVIVYSVQDQYWAPAEPTDTMTFNNYGTVDFTVQGWNGSAWVALGSVTGNNLVKRTLNFGAFTTDRIRVNITRGVDGYARLTEVEAFGTAVASGPDGFGSQRLQWIRGNSANESATCGGCTPSFRSRPTSKLGDIIHSAPSYVAAPGSAYPDSMESNPYSSFATAYVSRPAMIYVGSNDGMLHAFSASTGREAMAYVPASVYRNLSALTTSSLSSVAGEPVAHHYQVDGSPTIADAYYSGAWHTLLAGGLGGGGQGIYALDVTDPSAFTQANAASIVRWEFSDANDADMGYAFSQPLIVKTNNGRWSVIVGNGYNNSEDDGTLSSSGHAILFVLDAETGAVRAKIDTGAGSVATPNGLSGPIAVDTTGDGIADVVYAGDLNGNMWKFDLSSSSPGAWNVAFGGAPLFASGQPITVRPDVTAYTTGGYLVVFGTGRYVDTTDGSTTGQQTFYGVRDAGAAVAGLSSLTRQTIVSSSAVGSDANTYRLSTHAVGPATIDSPLSGDNAIPLADYNASKKGWYINLPASGERVVTDATIRAGRVIFETLIPNTDPCAFGGTGWVMEVDVMTGNRNDTPTFDTNNDKQISTADLNLNGTIDNASGRALSSIPAAPGIMRMPTPANGRPFENKYVNTSSGTVAVIGETAGMGTAGRTSWRQIQ
ncbi:MAG: PilC/PilY family type IV pilus protein [Betaproteobacteria bacterium]